MFIALICFVNTILDYSSKAVFDRQCHKASATPSRICQSNCTSPFRTRTRTRTRTRNGGSKPKKKAESAKRIVFDYRNTLTGMLDTACNQRRIDEYECEYEYEYSGTLIGRISDFNSNTYDKDDTTTMIKINTSRNLADENDRWSTSSVFSQDADFIQDNSDYQWFADYGYRAADTTNVCSTNLCSNTNTNNMHTSILSSLSTSYGYNDMARDLDANLAHVDMEDYRAEDIHNFLHALPDMCRDDNVHHESNGSVYKSEILFSPVKDVPLVSFSIDSLDCEEHDIMLTCQANKDNYTIAFEGSTIMDKSSESPARYDQNAATAAATNNVDNKTVESIERMSLDTTSSETDKSFVGKSLLICSESPHITWSKLKEENSADNSLLKRQSSGNNNTTAVFSSAGVAYADMAASYAFLKSQSLPNLNRSKRQSAFGININRSILGNYTGEQRDMTTQSNRFVKIYNLSRSQCGRKIHRTVFQNNFDLISQFINHKRSTSSHNSASGESNAAEATTATTATTTTTTTTTDKVRESVGCENFQDSLVADKIDVDRADALATMSDSCSSFSSHSGRIEALINRIDRVSTASQKNDRCDDANFVRQKYFDSARKFEKEQKKRKAVKAIKIMDRSMQTSSSDADSAVGAATNYKNESAADKPVFVMYPNYTLPDLSFIQEHAIELDLKNVFLWPQKFSPSPTTTEHVPVFHQQQAVERETTKKKRPCSCLDLDSIKNRDYQHIRDWESLIFLLPREYRKILSENAELKKYIDKADDFGRSLICTSATNDETIEAKGGCETSCSVGTQPSSGYRGSSTILSTDSDGPTMKHEHAQIARHYTHRPPLPKGILRNPVLHSIKSKKNLMNSKRYSMFELRKHEKKSNIEKRRSLPNEKIDENEANYSEDEGVDSAGSHCDSPGPHSDQDAKRLEYLLENAFRCNDYDSLLSKNQTMRKTVSFADHSRTPPNSPNCSVSAQQKAPSPYQIKLCSSPPPPPPPSSSPFDQTILHAECEASKRAANTRTGYCDQSSEYAYASSDVRVPKTSSYNYKKELIDAANEAVSRIDAADSDQTIAQMVLNHLCPALYAILNHGLKPTLETAFGDVRNSVWQVVEATSQQGPMTRALYELVLRLNNEDVLTEGLMKFNAFIFGLLNVRGLDIWLSYLRTRETIMRKHYLDTGILLSSSRGIASDRQLIDQLLSTLKPLADITFKLDLLYECRQLHCSLMQLEQNSPIQSGINRTSWVLKKIVRSLQNVANASGDETNDKNGITDIGIGGLRPRSCVDSSNGFGFNDVTSSMKKRWSGIQFGSKLASAFERLAVEDEEETYSDSLDPNINNAKIDSKTDDASLDATIKASTRHNEGYESQTEKIGPEVSSAKRELKFKQLQKKWEMLVEKRTPDGVSPSKEAFSNRNSEENGNICSIKSRIPRLVTSPVRPPSALHFTLLNKTSQQSKRCSPTSPSSVIPAVAPNKASSPTNGGIKRVNEFDSSRQIKEKNTQTNRSSRMDQSATSTDRFVRPTSLPQKLTRHQRPKLTGDFRRPSSSSRHSNSMTSKYVRTLGHRLPSDNGHLSYNEGEQLRVVLDVDDKWILCCRGDQKGLVPRSAVLPISGHL